MSSNAPTYCGDSWFSRAVRTAFAVRTAGSLLLVLSFGCSSPSTEPSASGYVVQSLAPGYRLSSVVVRGDTAFSARTDGLFEATLITNGSVVWSTRVRDVSRYWAPTGIAVGRDHIFIGAGQEVVALARGDGHIAWRFSSPNVESFAEVAISTDSVYVAFGQRRGTITLLRAVNGDVAWQRAVLPNSIENWFVAPVFVNGVLVYSRRPVPGPAPSDGELIALAVRTSNGDSLWSLTVNHNQGRNDYGGMRAKPIADGLIFSTNDGLLLNVRALDGLIRWQVTSPATSASDDRAITVAGNEVIAGSIITPGRVQSIDLATGKINWTYHSTIGSPATGLGVSASLVAFTAFGTQLVIVDRATREMRSIELYDLFSPGTVGSFHGTPVFVGDRIVVATSRGLITLRPK